MNQPLEAVNERRVGRPTSEETGRLNEDVLQAAFEVFSREGFGGASIEQIAQQSRTTRRSVLSRFRDKKTLLLAVVEMLTWRFQAQIAPSESILAAKPLETLKAVCWTMLEAIVNPEGLDFYRLALAHTGKFPEVGVIVLRFNDRILTDLEALIVRAQRSGAFVGREPATVATGLIGVFVSNPLNRSALGDPQFRDPALLRRYFDHVWSYVLGAS